MLIKSFVLWAELQLKDNQEMFQKGLILELTLLQRVSRNLPKRG